MRENRATHLVGLKTHPTIIAPVGVRTHYLPHTVASNMSKVSHALQPQSHQAYDQVTTYLRPKNGPIVERTYNWSQRSYDL